MYAGVLKFQRGLERPLLNFISELLETQLLWIDLNVEYLTLGPKKITDF